MGFGQEEMILEWDLMGKPSNKCWFYSSLNGIWRTMNVIMRWDRKPWAILLDVRGDRSDKYLLLVDDSTIGDYTNIYHQYFADCNSVLGESLNNNMNLWYTCFGWCIWLFWVAHFAINGIVLNHGRLLQWLIWLALKFGNDCKGKGFTATLLQVRVRK